MNGVWRRHINLPLPSILNFCIFVLCFVFGVLSILYIWNVCLPPNTLQICATIKMLSTWKICHSFLIYNLHIDWVICNLRYIKLNWYIYVKVACVLIWQINKGVVRAHSGTRLQLLKHSVGVLFSFLFFPFASPYL